MARRGGHRRGPWRRAHGSPRSCERCRTVQRTVQLLLSAAVLRPPRARWLGRRNKEQGRPVCCCVRSPLLRSVRSFSGVERRARVSLRWAGVARRLFPRVFLGGVRPICRLPARPAPCLHNTRRTREPAFRRRRLPHCRALREGAIVREQLAHPCTQE
jgi:hypothetical protein